MTERQRENTAYLTLALLGVAFIAAIMASNSLLSGWRLDLTENQLYTLSDGTETLLRGLEEPINVYYFFSDRETEDIQFLRGYATRVREMLEEMAAVAGGRLNLQIIDPLPFSEEEDRAALYGLENLNLGTLGDSIYFGLAATNSVGDQGIIEVFDPSKEASLEYDLARLIYSLANPEKTVVGLVSGVSMAGGFDPQLQQPTQPWVIYQQARQLFDVRTLPQSFTEIEDDIGLLWIVHPQGLDEQTLYAIDQFALGGGRVLLFIDPLAEIASMPAGPAGMGAQSSSDLEPLLSAWGIEYVPDQVVVDNVNALSVSGLGARPVRHIGLLGLNDAAMDQADVVTTGLASLNIGTAGHLGFAEEGAETQFTPLLTSSPESALVPSARFQLLQDPGELLDDFVPTAESYTLAARLSGRLETAFPDGAPVAEESAGEGADAENIGAGHLSETDNGNLIVVADVDVLSDRLWVQRQRSLFGQEITTAFAGNGDLLSNALANLSGSTDLINLRSREAFARPFDTVEALRREADARFRETEQQLQAQLAETEQRLAELQSARDDTSSLLLTPEQQAELSRFQDEQLRIRRELRAVQRDLDRSIEQLGTALRVVNIVAVPLALTVIALLIVLLKRRRRTAT